MVKGVSQVREGHPRAAVSSLVISASTLCTAVGRKMYLTLT